MEYFLTTKQTDQIKSLLYTHIRCAIDYIVPSPKCYNIQHQIEKIMFFLGRIIYALFLIRLHFKNDSSFRRNVCDGLEGRNQVESERFRELNWRYGLKVTSNTEKVFHRDIKTPRRESKIPYLVNQNKKIRSKRRIKIVKIFSF